MNKTVLVTGAGTGIGAATAIMFAKNGYNVIIHYNKSYEEALKVDEECKKYGIDTLLVKADIANELEIKEMIDKILIKYSKIDVLINNAGIAIDTLFSDKTKENFMKTLEVNLVGTFLVSKYVSEVMLKNKYGRIINISSTNGIDKYFPMCLDYDASKAGIISLTHNLALQLKPYINVNCIAPGWIGTENELKDVDLEYIKSEEEKIFVGRIGKPEEVASLAFFLASKEANYINNEVIKIDGGMY
mgnify:CR=1 FL=1